MTDVSKLVTLAGAISSSSQKIKDAVTAVAKATVSQETQINSNTTRITKLEADLAAVKKDVEVLKGNSPAPRPPVAIPVNSVLPFISGSPVTGQTLTVSTGTWSGSPTGYSYQWYSCDASGNNCTVIANQISNSYTTVVGDQSHTLRVTVKATNLGGTSAPVTTTASGVVTPPSAGQLPWAPPDMSGATVINVASYVNAQGKVLLPTLNANTDYILNMPATPIVSTHTDNNPCMFLNGGRHIQIIGGEMVRNAKIPPGFTGTPQAIVIGDGVKGIVHLEGLYIHGQWGQCVLFAQQASGNFSETQIQRCRFEALHPIQDPPAVASNETVHTDAIQSYGGPYKLRVCELTTKTMGTGFQLQPHNLQSSSVVVQDYQFIKIDIEQKSSAGYALWKADGVAKWGTYNQGCYIYNLGNLAWANGDWGQGQIPVGTSGIAGWNVTGNTYGWANTGEDWIVGLRPGGDYVLAANVGTGYVSPGYTSGGGGGGGGGTNVTFSITTNGDDSTGEYQSASWPANGGTWVDDSGLDGVYAAKHFTGGIYYDVKGYLRFDTSSLPDGATINSASLKLYLIDKNDNNNYSLVGDYYDFGGSPTVAADWIQTPGSSIFTAVDITGMGTGGVNTIPLTDLSGINKTGYTGIRLSLSSGTPTLLNHVKFASLEHTTGVEAQLVVNYT